MKKGFDGLDFGGLISKIKSQGFSSRGIIKKTGYSISAVLLAVGLIGAPSDAHAKAGGGKSFGTLKVKPKSTGRSVIPNSSSSTSTIGSGLGTVLSGHTNYFNLAIGGVNVIQAATLSEEKIENIAAAQFSAVKGKEGKNVLPLLDNRYRRVNMILDKVRMVAMEHYPETRSWKWETVVINSQTVNAWCMPGGKIAVYTGLIEKLNLTDDEIAVVGGHEITHALKQHGLKRMRAELLSTGGVYLAGSKVSGAVPIGLVGKHLMTLGYSRENERESDHIGLLLAAEAGYDPRAGITLFEKFHKNSGGSGDTSWFSSHPGDNERVANMKKDLPQAEAIYRRKMGIKN